MENFPANSKNPTPRSEQPEPPKVDRVVTGEVVRRKTPLGRRLSQNLMGGDPRNILSWMVHDVVSPALRDLVYDAFTGGVERAIYGEASPGSRRGGRSKVAQAYTAYNLSSSKPARGGRGDDRRDISRRARANHSFDEILIPTMVEANEVLDRLEALIDKYDAASVANLYEMVGVQGTYMDDKFGWTDLRGARPVRTRSGYLLDLPKPEPID